MLRKWQRVRSLILASALCVGPGLSACGDEDDTNTDIDDATGKDASVEDGEDGVPTDGEPGDGEPTDGEPTDGAPTDGEPTDGEPTDGEPTDGEPTDGDPGLPDAGSDAGIPDLPDAALPVDAAVDPQPDAAVEPVDASVPDAGDSLDASAPDASTPDAGIEDAGTSDAGTEPVCELPDATLPLGDNRALNGIVIAPATTCNSPAGELPAKLFDGDDATKFLCRVPRPTLGVVFPNMARYVVKTYTLTSGNDAPGRDPKHWRIEGTDDGLRWDVVDERSDEVFTGRGETRRFDIANCKAYARFRLVIVENNGEALFQLAEFRLFGEPEAASTNLATGATITSTCPNTANAAQSDTAAFDGNVLSKWFCGRNQTPAVELTFAGGASHRVISYSVTSGDDLPDRDPASWMVEGSNDGVEWAPLGEELNQTFAERSYVRQFVLSNDRSFARYRFRITANNGSPDFQVAEFALYGE